MSTTRRSRKTASTRKRSTISNGRAICRTRRNRGFTIVELSVAIGIFILLLSIFIPSLMKLRESNRRTQCADNLKQIREALRRYADNNGNNFPRVVYDAEHNPDGYTAYTGADDANPFAPDSAVKPNDVTASLWLLVRENLVTPQRFICPSADDWADLMNDASGKKTVATSRGNFRKSWNLSYSYSSPFSSAPWYKMNDTQPSDFAIMADKNAGIAGDGDNVAGYPSDASPFDLAHANSHNHNRAGQNVLYADGHVAFQSTPYCGDRSDNIYTALSDKVLANGVWPPFNSKGFWANTIGPSWNADSYLVPTDDEGPR